MTLSNKLLRRLRRLATVPRWVVIPTIQRQNVAEHSFHVAVLADYLSQYSEYTNNNPARHLEVVRTAMTHDSREAVSGDIPSPYKRFVEDKDDPEYGEHKQITVIVKLADLLESIIFLTEETSMGNGTVTPILNELQTKFFDKFIEFEQRVDRKMVSAQDVLKDLRKTFSPYTHPIMEELG